MEFDEVRNSGLSGLLTECLPVNANDYAKAEVGVCGS